MNDFKKGGFRKSSGGFGGRSKFGGDKKFGTTFKKNRTDDRGSRDSERAELFTTTCTECGKSCEVPFRPSGDKPVYCRECFAMKRGAENEFTPKRDAHPQREFARDVRHEHNHSGNHQGSGTEEIKQQLAKLETKLNRILEIINPPIEKVKVVITPVSTTPGAPIKAHKATVAKKVAPAKKVAKKKK